MADEALKCFTTLLDSIPGWIADLENILQQAAERQKEILFENQPAQDDPPVDSGHTGPWKASKSVSVRSKRSNDAQADVDISKANEVGASPAQIQAPHMTQSDALRWAQRKRKTASAESGVGDWPHKYRSKSMVVIYYDGETQKRFEGMVRAIGTSRNTLRKGKMSAKLDVMTRSRDGKGNEDGDSDDPIEMPRMILRSAARTKQSAAISNGDGTAAFDQVDGFLEKAQLMCERAAHQVLRDGDCALEIKHAKGHFADAQKLGEAELPTWQTRAQEAAERDRRSEERRAAAEEEEKNEQTPVSSSEEQLVSKDPFSSSPASLEVVIEPDDSDGGDDPDFAINIMQLGRPYSKRPYLRSKSLTAH